MASADSALLQKAKQLELEGLRNYKITSGCIFALDELLHDVYVVLRPKSSDYYHRRDLVRIFNDIAKEIYGKSNDCPVVEEFGSFVMDMFSAESDLDLSVNFSDTTINFPRDKKIQTLRKFSKKLFNLQRKGHVTRVQPIMTARVPVLKVIDLGTGIECDISVENRDGINKSKIIHLISIIDDRFPKLCFLMKAWAKANGINSSKDRTLNSLSIISLVAFHLQGLDPPILPPFSAIFKEGTDPAAVAKVVQTFRNFGKGNKESIAKLFVTLLIKLASVEKLWTMGLCASAHEGSWTSKSWDSKAGYIIVEDFTDQSQNIARAVGETEVIKIYNCINESIHNIWAFMEGQMPEPELREALFGPDPIPIVEEKGSINLNSNAMKGLLPIDEPELRETLFGPDPIPIVEGKGSRNLDGNAGEGPLPFDDSAPKLEEKGHVNHDRNAEKRRLFVDDYGVQSKKILSRDYRDRTQRTYPSMLRSPVLPNSTHVTHCTLQYVAPNLGDPDLNTVGALSHNSMHNSIVSFTRNSVLSVPPCRPNFVPNAFGSLPHNSLVSVPPFRQNLTHDTIVLPNQGQMVPVPPFRQYLAYNTVGLPNHNQMVPLPPSRQNLAYDTIGLPNDNQMFPVPPFGPINSQNGRVNYDQIPHHRSRFHL